MNFFGSTALIILFIAGSAMNVPAQHSQSQPKDMAALQSHDSVVVYDRPHILKTNLAGLLSLFYEAQVQPKRSLQASINRINFGFLGNEDKFFILTTAFKFYLSKKESTERRPHPSGFYVSPYLRYVNIHNTGNGLFSGRRLSKVTYNLFGGGVIAGYQIIFRKGLTLDFFAGGGYLPLKASKVTYTYGTNYVAEVSTENYKPDIRIGICVGYAFKKK